MRDAPRYDWRADVRARLAGMPLTPEAEAQIVDEVGQHLEEQFAELGAAGDPAKAREQLLAQLRDQSFEHVASGRRRRVSLGRRVSMRLEAAGGIRRDMAHAARSLLRNPGVALPAVVALALGIGLTSAMFSVVYSTLLRNLPYPGGDRIVAVTQLDPARPAEEQDAMPLADFDGYRVRQHSFELFGAYFLGTANVSGGDRPDRLGAVRVTPEVLELTDVRPLLGRVLTARDDAPDAPLVALIAARTWHDRFASDSAVIGKPLRVNGRLHTIVGVMPDGFVFPNAAQVWMPLHIDRATMRNGGPDVLVVGRLRRGTSLEVANAELKAIASVMAAERPDSTAARMRPLARSFARNVLRTQVYTLLYAMLAAVGLVLVVACGNVANLLLHRAADRTKEIGVLTALGASRGAIIRRALVESTLLAAIGAILGLAIASAFIRVYNHAFPANERPFWIDIRLHLPVLAFTAGIAFVSGALAGVLPALQSARVDTAAILKSDVLGVSALRIGRLSRAVLVVEIAVASAMLVAAGFITKSIIRLTHVDPGFRTSGIVTARVTLSTADTIRRARFFADLDRAMASMPGVAHYDIGSGSPASNWMGGSVEIEGHTYARNARRPRVRRLSVSEGFFSTYDVKILRGRGIEAGDRADRERVAVVSEAFVRANFPNGDPLGKRIRIAGEGDAADWLTIVGVMPTLFTGMLDNNPYPQELVTSFWQDRSASSASVSVLGDGDVIAALRETVTALDAETPLYDAMSVDAMVARSAWPMRLFGGTFVVFGVAAIALAAIGLYAVMAFSVSRRVRELGIRIALGATRGGIVRMICAQASLTIGLGMGVGLLLGALLARGMRGVLFGVSTNDPLVFAVVAGVLAAVALIACVVPANRVTRLDPVAALRGD
jgi:predicted permease